MGLQHHQDGKNAKNHGIGHNALPPLQHFLPLFGDAVGEVDDDRQLGDLRGLEGKDTVDAQPAAGVVVFDADTGNDDQHQQKEREDQQESGRAAPALIVEPGGKRQTRQTHGGVNGLPLEVVGGGSGFVVGGGKAGGKQHHKADDRQQQHQQQEGNVDASALGGLQMLLLDGLAAHFLRMLDGRLLVTLGHGTFLLSVWGVGGGIQSLPCVRGGGAKRRRGCQVINNPPVTFGDSPLYTRGPFGAVHYRAAG